MLAAEVLQAGGVVVYPTETLYGIGASAWNRKALSRVHTLKRRSELKPFLVVVNSREAIHKLTDEITEEANRLMENFWPGPLTLLFRASIAVPPEVTGGTGKIGVRIPSSPLCLRLCELCGDPITSTSANLSGEPPLNSPAEIERALGPSADLYLDCGPLPPSLPSTIIDVSGKIPNVVRAGALPLQLLRDVFPNLPA